MSDKPQNGRNNETLKCESTKVLIVDDEHSILAVQSRRLQLLGFSCAMASSVDEASKILNSEQSIGVVVVDFHIGDKTVIDLLPTLDRLPPEVVVIGNSGDGEAASRFASVGITDFLLKPWTIAEFQKALPVDSNVH